MKRYHVTTQLGTRTIAFQEPLDDPFVRHVLHLGWRDLLAGLLRRGLIVTTIIGADRETTRAVMNLNTQPVPRSAQRGTCCEHGRDSHWHGAGRCYWTGCGCTNYVAN